jgi:hypothetical protein
MEGGKVLVRQFVRGMERITNTGEQTGERLESR